MNNDSDQPAASGKAIASLVLGLLGCALSCFTAVPGLILGVVGFLMFVPGIWAEWFDSESFCKVTITLGIFSFSFAQASPRGPPRFTGSPWMSMGTETWITSACITNPGRFSGWKTRQEYLCAWRQWQQR